MFVLVLLALVAPSLTGGQQHFGGRTGGLEAPLPFGGPISPKHLPQLLHQPSLRNGEDIEAPFRNGGPIGQQQQPINNFNHPEIPPNFNQQPRKQPTFPQNGAGIRRAQPQPQQQQPRFDPDEFPCPQQSWLKIMEENVKAKDATSSLNAIQSGFGRAFQGQIFMVLCTTSEERKKFGRKIQLQVKGDGYCNMVKDGVECQAAKLSGGGTVTLNGFGGFAAGQGLSLNGIGK